MIPAARKDSFAAQLADFSAKATALHLQVICQRLTVVGDIESAAMVLLRLVKQVGQQLFARRAARGDLDFLLEEHVLRGKNSHEIVNELPVKRAGIRAGIQDALTVEEEHLRFQGGNGGYRQRVHAGAGKGFAEELGRSNMRKDAAMSETIQPDDLYCAGEHHADVPRRIPLP